RRKSSFVVRGPGERDTSIVDRDVGMMIRTLGIGYEPVDKGDRLGKSLEGVLLANGVAVARPALQRLQLRVNFRPRLKRHLRTSQPKSIRTNQLQVRITP